MEFNVIKTPKNIKGSLSTPFPDSVYKYKDAGKTQLTYVAGQAVIDKLNATFGYFGWSWEIIDKFVQPSEDKVVKYKWENGSRKELNPPIREPQLPVAHVIGRLTVHLQDENGNIFDISKTAPGAQCLVGGQSEQENIFKGAHTDALKKAATMFGIGLELYRDENEAYYFSELMYENPWTEEEMSKHKESLDYYNLLINSGITEEEMNNYINTFSSGAYPTTDYLLPDFIDSFVEYLKANIEKGGK